MFTSSGIYELVEAGRYLHATTPKKPPSHQAIRRWVRSGLPATEATLTMPKGLFLSFEDLISLRMVVALKLAGFSLQHIRAVHAYLQHLTGYNRPFALKALWVSDTEIFVEMENQLLSASRRGQYAMEFIKDWLRRLRRLQDGSLDLTFRNVNGGQEAAATWMPHPYVVLDPLVQFGAPSIEGTRIPTKSIWSMVLGGDKPESIARDYELPIYKVHSALDWEKKIAGLPA